MLRALALLVLASITALAQQRAATDIAKLTPDQIKARDKLEDEIAEKIVVLRKTAGLDALGRFRDKKLRKLTCSYAVQNDFKFLDPNSHYASPSLQLVVSADEFAKAYSEQLEEEKRSNAKNRCKSCWKNARFAVSAWPAQDQGKYWVKYEYRLNEFLDWVDRNLTDDMFNKNEWKKSLAEPCKKVD